MTTQANHVRADGPPPATMQEALRSPIGRPPCALVAFGFGGAVCLMRPTFQADGRGAPAPVVVTSVRGMVMEG